MTVQEKAGQLNQYSGFEILTGDIDDSKISERNERIKNGLLGSVLNVLGTEDVEKAQRYAVEQTRLGIPLIFAFDVIHGYRTIFPIPWLNLRAGTLKPLNAQRVLRPLKPLLPVRTGPLHLWWISLMTRAGVE
jgi:hypothetical protein